MEQPVRGARRAMWRCPPRPRLPFALASIAACLLVSTAASARGTQDLDPQAGDLAIEVPPPPILPPTPSGLRRELRYDLRYDIPLVIAGYVSWTTLEQLRPQLSSDDCRFCDTELNAVDRAGRGLRWSHSGTTVTISDVTANALVPSATVGLTALLTGREGKLSNVPLDILFIAQATTFANGATLVAKYAFARSRPYARAARLAQGDDDHASRTGKRTSPSARDTRATRSPSPSPSPATPWPRCGATGARAMCGPLDALEWTCVEKDGAAVSREPDKRPAIDAPPRSSSEEGIADNPPSRSPTTAQNARVSGFGR